MTPLQNHIQAEDTMPVSLSIKDVPEEVLQRLRARAHRNHRSLQKELLAIVETAAFGEAELTVDVLREQVAASGLSTPDESAGWIRELRNGL
jgi:antitoxin FitA